MQSGGTSASGSNEDALPSRAGQPRQGLAYEADLLGNIQQALAGLQGYGVMALELIQNADDARKDHGSGRAK